MAQVLTFTGYRPAPRYDDIPFTIARIQESATEAGVFVTIDTITLDPVDSDPSDPLERDLTTELATDTPSLWYRIVFVDASGDTLQPTLPIQNLSADAAYATATELARILKLRAPTAEQTAAMERVLLAAAGEIRSEIGAGGLAGWELALVTEVNLERAVEHWQQQEAAFGIIGLGGVESVAVHTARDSWDRHAHKLAPLKSSWGMA